MKKTLLFLLFVLPISCVTIKVESTKTQNAPKNKIVTTQHETFSYQEGDSTYVMQKYFLVLLKKGKNRNHSKNHRASGSHHLG